MANPQGFGATEAGEAFLEVLEELAASKLIKTKEETLLYLGAWMANRLRDQSRNFDDVKFRERAKRAIFNL